MLRTGRENGLRGSPSLLLRTHKNVLNGFPLARSSSGGGGHILLPTLKKKKEGRRSPRAPICNPPAPLLLFFMVPPNDTCAVRFIIIVRVAKKLQMKCAFHNRVYSSAQVKNACRCVDTREAVFLTEGPRADMLVVSCVLCN